MRINETRNVARLIEGLSGGASDYSKLTNKPSINNVTLSGNKTTAELGINEGTTNYAELSNKPSINGVTLTGEKSASALGLLSMDDLMVVLSADANDAIEAGGTISDTSDVAALNAVKGKYDVGEQLPIFVLAKDSSLATVLYYITSYYGEGADFEFTVANVAQATQTVISYKDTEGTWAATPN